MSTNLLSRPSDSETSVVKSSLEKSFRAIAVDDSRLSQVKETYQADQQVKYLYLQAEIDVLLQQLQSLKQRNLDTNPSLSK
jgi:hypothetical protein